MPDNTRTGGYLETYEMDFTQDDDIEGMTVAEAKAALASFKHADKIMPDLFAQITHAEDAMSCVYAIWATLARALIESGWNSDDLLGAIQGLAEDTDADELGSVFPGSTTVH